MAAAHVAGVDRLFQVGGAQAIAALAYGTESVPHVDKIFGPGNIFVVLAKEKSSVLSPLIQPWSNRNIDRRRRLRRSADRGGDMLAQAEHDPMASAILITNSSSLAEEVADQLRVQLPALPRAAIAEAALRNNGMVVVVGSIDTAIELANQYAPEHLCLLLHDPWAAVSQVRNAGGIFVGEQSPEALGDYTAGPSHVMPTGGTARFFSPIHLADFTKVSPSPLPTKRLSNGSVRRR